MKTIHKYVLPDAENKVPTFEGVRYLHVANQRGQITVWAEVHTLNRERMGTLHVVPTGGSVPSGSHYIGTALLADGDFVLHVYGD